MVNRSLHWLYRGVRTGQAVVDAANDCITKEQVLTS